METEGAWFQHYGKEGETKKDVEIVVKNKDHIMVNNMSEN